MRARIAVFGILAVAKALRPASQQLSRRSVVIGGFIAAVAPVPAASAITPVEALDDASDTLHTLLDNWENAVVDCTFADVPRELLETKNKEQLLEKAKVSALFDKSASVVSCKTTNRKVRDYIGATGKGPVVGLPKKMRASLDSLKDPDSLDDFVQLSELVEQDLSRAGSLSYTSGVADFYALNNFDPSEQDAVIKAPNSNLAQARVAIQSAVENLDRIRMLMER